MNKLRYFIYILTLGVISACTDKLGTMIDDDLFADGDAVRFTAQVPQISTRATRQEYFEGISQLYHEVQEDYSFRVDMYEEGSPSKIASADYNPTKQTIDNVTTYDDYGTLTEAEATAKKYLYWPSNVRRYAFHAVSSNSDPSVADAGTPGKSDQTSQAKLFAKDLIEGYGYVPGWDDATNAPVANRNIDGLNYMTNKEWYAANKAWGAPSEMSQAQLVEHWKKVPLFMHHRRSRITVLLKAGEGVKREQIKYDAEFNPRNIITEIYSYDHDNQQTVVKPLLGSYDCHYTSPDPAPEETIATACYDAIVDPHDYTEGDNITEQKILSINLSGMKFSFYAANDKAFSSAPDAPNEDVKARYNLTEGKHLILTVTLSTDTRKILITAYVVDWEDWPFSSICDDFGQAADPMPINNKWELIEFLNNPQKNKPGNVGVIMPLDFNLINAVEYDQKTVDEINKPHLIEDTNGKKPGEDGYTPTYETGYTPLEAGTVAGEGWDPGSYELKATLKLAGATITTNQCLFNKISAAGSVVNGTIVIEDRKDKSEGPLECAVAKENHGMVERVNVQPGNTERRATRAGLVTRNYNTIYCCTSQMPVYNAGGETEILIGGIAAEMLYERDGSNAAIRSTLPTIDQCNVNARIDGGTNVRGGGIAGSAEGKLSNNTYEYGITLLQNKTYFKNILYTKGAEDLTVSGNSWSTKIGNEVPNGTGVSLTNSRPESDCYDQVLDSQAELNALVSSNTYNNTSSRFRIADSFVVDGDTWGLGLQNLQLSDSRNLFCELDCNDKTITLTGADEAKMLFSNILGKLYDLTLVLEKPIVARPNKDGESEAERLTARAPLAYAVAGDNAKLSNVKVKTSNDAYVMSTASGGLVVWAYNKATIEDCQSNVDVRIALPEGTGNQQTYFVGGLVNSAAEATIVRCTYQRDNLNETEEAHATSGVNIYYGGIVGGTSKKDSNTPYLHIADCTSWLVWEATDELPHAAWGGIIGYSKYQNTLSELVTAMDGECQGNWWAAIAGASAQGWASGMNEEKVIGKKNSLQPMRDNNY